MLLIIQSLCQMSFLSKLAFSVMNLTLEVSHGTLACCIKQADRHSRHSVTVRLNIRMGKTSDLSNFECGMIVGARRTGSSISETSAILGFSRMTLSRVYRKWCNK